LNLRTDLLMSNFIVGLTGGIGSGKTTIANLFVKLGIDIIDADVIARDVVALDSPGLKAIAKYFGDDYIQVDGTLDRALLRKKIFSNDTDKRWLNELLHPLIRQQITTELSSATSNYCLLVAPLLIENKLTNLVDRVLVIDVNEADQISRTTKRDKNSIAQVQAIIASQINRADRLKHADDVIENNAHSFDTLETAVLKLHQSYLILSNTS